MLPEKYAPEDADIIDYRYYRVPGTDKCFRGPEPELSGAHRAIAFLGAASCFGRFVQHPYPELIGTRLGRPIRNFGYGGARAPFYYRDPALMRLIDRSAAVVVEVFSARGVATGQIESRDDSSAFLRWTGSNARFAFADQFFRQTWTEDPEKVRNLVREIRERYVEQMHSLLWRMNVPVVLLWLSQRPPELHADYERPELYEFSFPHLVDRATLTEISQQRVTTVEVVSQAGLPQRLPERQASSTAGLRRPMQNRYYPSPEMHQLAADRLAPVLAGVLGQ